MDPSNFGSFSSGGSFGGAGVSGTPNNGVAAGTNPTVNPEQSNPVSAQGFVGAQTVQPQMQSARPVIPGVRPRVGGGVQTGAQAQQQMQVMGSQTQAPIQQPMQFQSQMVSSGEGDVFLSGVEPKKSKKGLIVGIVVSALVLVGAGIYFVLQNSNNGVLVGSSTAETKTLLNKYSNYLLYQTESDEDVGNDVVTWPSNKIDDSLAVVDEGSKVMYFDTLISLFNVFSENYYNDVSFKKSLSEDELKLIDGLIDNNKSALEALKIYAITPNLSMEDMVGLYLEQGVNKMMGDVDSIYADLTLSGNQLISNYGAAKIDLASKVGELYLKYDSYGCINNGMLADDCVRNNAVGDTLISEQEALLTDVNNLDDMEWHMVNDVTGLSQMLYDCFYNTEGLDEKQN